jgi:hypothetical protein
MEQTRLVENVSTICLQTAEPYGEPPSDVGIEMAIRKLKNGKATGHIQIPIELVKEGRKELKKAIYELLSKIWEEEILPQK